jgi:hypothetical protein
MDRVYHSEVSPDIEHLVAVQLLASPNWVTQHGREHPHLMIGESMFINLANWIFRYNNPGESHHFDSWAAVSTSDCAFAGATNTVRHADLLRTRV